MGLIQRRDGYRLWIGGPVPPGAAGITLGSLIIVKKRAAENQHLLRHELCHVRQWRELGIARFGYIYLSSYVRFRLAGFSHWDAYRRIPLEIEAEWESVRET